MNFVLGVALIWLGGGMLFVAMHTPDVVVTPWDMYKSLFQHAIGGVS